MVALFAKVIFLNPLLQIYSIHKFCWDERANVKRHLAKLIWINHPRETL